MNRRTVRILLGLALSAGLLSACTGADPVRKAAEPTGSAPPSPATARTPPPLRSVPFTLRTHCGVTETRIGAVYYEADPPLTDGSGNPPDGWDNPDQEGTMTTRSATEAVFTDDAGHEVIFRARPGAKEFKTPCVK
ncbi:hypothetical protein [Streptomyces sp. NPDC020965]|uniref:hypothetical protein n=1 Tax=Streptomyces sp. NPDC020965 TaxID=3365105 RepID=UPI0037BDA8F8